MVQSTNQDFCISLSDLAKFLEISAEELRSELKSEFGPLKSQWIEPSRVRQIMGFHGYKYPQGRIVSIQMLKGGVAKTTSLLNIGLRAAMYGARVLFVDLDQQANLSFALGIEDEERAVWIDLVEKKAKIQDLIVNVGSQIDLIPSNLNNSVLDRVLLTSNRNWAQSVVTPLGIVRENYDLILIDTAPALSAVNTAVTVASDEIILPVNPDKFSWMGLLKHRDELSALRSDFGLGFAEKILFTRYDAREKASREVLQKCVERFAGHMMKSYIRSSSDVKNALRGEKTIFAGSSPVKDDFDAVTREVLGFPPPML